jgi:hypothetical protein
MMQPGPVAVKAVELAEGFVGTTEAGGENRGAQVERFLASAGLPPGQPWCAAFVRHCLEKAARFLNAGLDGLPDSGWCPAYYAWAVGRGLWVPVQAARMQNPQVARGDLILFWFDAKGRHAHMGFVARQDDQGLGVWTVEGNTSPGPGMEREGDGVYRRRRTWPAMGARGGFVRIPF